MRLLKRVISIAILALMLSITVMAMDERKPEKVGVVSKNSRNKIDLLICEVNDGNADAMYNLGLRYEKGRGVPENKAKAIELYREAAAKENSNAIARLGLCYELGIGLEKNVDEAVRLWHQAGELKNSFAMCKLGSCYETGLGVKKDVVKAAEWYEKAAQKGDVEAMYKLGLCYANGVGVLKDDAKATIWRNRALERGFKYPNVDLRTYSQVIDDIFSLMKNPSNKSILDKIKNYYEKVDLKLKLLIVKHLIFLKNMGHQDAINALNELRPDIKQNCCPVEYIVDGELDPEKIEKLFAEKNL